MRLALRCLSHPGRRHVMAGHFPATRSTAGLQEVANKKRDLHNVWEQLQIYLYRMWLRVLKSPLSGIQPTQSQRFRSRKAWAGETRVQDSNHGAMGAL